MPQAIKDLHEVELRSSPCELAKRGRDIEVGDRIERGGGIVFIVKAFADAVDLPGRFALGWHGGSWQRFYLDPNLIYQTTNGL